MPELPDRNLALELVRVTEAAAMAAARWVGRGDKIAADQAAVDAMRFMLGTIDMDGTVVIGEGEKDEAPMLFNGESIGNGNPPAVDIAVDPLEGTNLCAKGQPSALAVIAVAERGTMFDPGPCVYMEKLVTDNEAAAVIDITRPIAENVKAVAAAKGKPVNETTVMMLDRERHEEAIDSLRSIGARIRLITDGDVSAALIAARMGSSVDLLYGVGGTPEGVLAAAAIRCLGGRILGRLWPRNDEERTAAIAAGYDLDKVLAEHDLVRGNDIFFAATGVTDGDMLQGVRYNRRGATTESLIMRSRSGTVRVVQAEHAREKLTAMTGVQRIASAASV
jgi:fructose-1,6-bisphosphatase II